MGRQHAVVIGASIAGMCAARVLSDHYAKVTVFERDSPFPQPANRSAIPQGKHVHLLMARGAAEFEGLFPGVLDDMVSAGVPILENRPDCISFGAAGHLLGTQATLRDEFTAYVPSRPHLEWQIRRRALAIPNVELVRRGIAEPQFDPVEERVTGVLLETGDESSAVPADLVVDATGRGTRLPVWLEQWGYGRPGEDTVEVGIGYATHQVHIPDGLIEEKVVVAGATRDKPLGLGMLFYEDGNWGVTTFGTGKVEPPQNFGEICALADEILPARQRGASQGRAAWRDGVPQVPDQSLAALRQDDPLPHGHHPVRGRRRELQPDVRPGHDDDLDPGGQPARGAPLRRRRDRHHAVPATAKTTWPVWMMTAIGDLSLHNATGEAQWWYRPVGRLFDQFLGAAETDTVLAEWFLTSLQPARQPLHGALGAIGRAHHPAQHATLVGRATQR